MVGGDPRCCELLLYNRAQLGIADENGWQEIHQVLQTWPGGVGGLVCVEGVCLGPDQSKDRRPWCKELGIQMLGSSQSMGAGRAWSPRRKRWGRQGQGTLDILIPEMADVGLLSLLQGQTSHLSLGMTREADSLGPWAGMEAEKRGRRRVCWPRATDRCHGWETLMWPSGFPVLPGLPAGSFSAPGTPALLRG